MDRGALASLHMNRVGLRLLDYGDRAARRSGSSVELGERGGRHVAKRWPMLGEDVLPVRHCPDDRIQPGHPQCGHADPHGGPAISTAGGSLAPAALPPYIVPS